MSESDPTSQLKPVDDGKPAYIAPPDEGKRDPGSAFVFAAVALLVPAGALFISFGYRPGWFQLSVLIVYTLIIPYIASDRYLREVPWDSLTTLRFLITHSVALTVVAILSTAALSAKPFLPAWITTQGRKGSLFELGLVLVFLALAFYECSFITKHGTDEED